MRYSQRKLVYHDTYEVAVKENNDFTPINWPPSPYFPTLLEDLA
jgi:hypothetical protein